MSEERALRKRALFLYLRTFFQTTEVLSRAIPVRVDVLPIELLGSHPVASWIATAASSTYPELDSDPPPQKI